MRKRMPGLEASRSFCTASAACTAPTAVSNRASTESPAMSTTRPWCDCTWLRNTLRQASSEATVARSSVAMRREYPAASAARIAARRCRSAMESLLRLDAGLLHHLAPGVVLGLAEGGERLGRARRGLQALLGE